MNTLLPLWVRRADDENTLLYQYNAGLQTFTSALSDQCTPPPAFKHVNDWSSAFFHSLMYLICNRMLFLIGWMNEPKPPEI